HTKLPVDHSLWKLEVEPAAELQRARVAKGGDVTKRSAAHLRAGIAGELGMIQQIERLDANLELALMVDVEPANATRIDVCHSRSTELIPMRVAEMRRND